MRLHANNLQGHFACFALTNINPYAYALDVHVHVCATEIHYFIFRNNTDKLEHFKT